MDTEGKLEEPVHPLNECTTGELSRYRSALERRITELGRIAGSSSAISNLRQRLSAVLCEQTDRLRLDAYNREFRATMHN